MTRPKPTLRMVAARAGVAPSTASLIMRGEGRFSHETVSRVLASARDLGYASGAAPAWPLAPGSTNIAGVVAYTPAHGTLRDPHSLDVTRGLHRTLAQHAIALMLLPPIHNHRFDEVFAAMPLDIVFLLTTPEDTTAVRQAAAERGVVVAHLESGGPQAPPPMVEVDDIPPMQDVARHLLSLGHSTVAAITLRHSSVLRSGLVEPPPYEQIENIVVRGRLEGLALGGLPPRYMFETAHASAAEAVEGAKLLMRLEPRPTAIVCFSDTLAEGAITGVRELGLRVPEDVSVTGYDATPIPSLAPHRLTSVHQDGVVKGDLLARIGLALRAGGAAPRARLETFFLEGTTTGPAPLGM